MVFAHDTAIEVLNSQFSIFKVLCSVVFFFVCLVLFTNDVKAQVVVNEIEPYAEWVELYKTDSGIVSLDGCTIYFHNSTSSSQKKVLSSSDNFSDSENFKKFDTGDNWLNNDGDSVILECSWGQNTVSYGSGGVITKPPENKSVGRYPDGSSSLYVLDNPTPANANVYTPPASPTPTPPPSPSPSPSPPPSPSPIPTPTPTPTKKPSPTPVASRFPSPSPIIQTEDEETLARGETLGLGITSSPSPEAEATNEPKKFPLASVSLITGGLALVGVASYLFFRSFQKEKREKAIGRVQL